MSTDHPRRVPLTAAGRLRNVVDASPLLARGERKSARPTRGTSGAAARIPALETVYHGDDGSVQRPSAECVRWRGVAEPLNALDDDFWYRENYTP